MASRAQAQISERNTTGSNTIAALWRAITRLEKSKINKPAIAVRNSLGVAIPLAVGIALGNPTAGAAVATGALNVSYSDGTDPYAHRARRMLTWSVLGAVAAFSGSAAGPHHWAAIALTAAWAFLAGMLVSISSRAGDLGLNTLVALVVFAARGPSTIRGAMEAALLVLAGGLLQTLLALLLWPVHRYEPERRAIARVFADLAEAITSAEDEALAEPLSATPDPQEQDTLAALGRDRSVDGERFRLLFDQADRIRLSAFLLRRLQSHFAYQALGESRKPGSDGENLIGSVDQIFQNASVLLRGVADNVLSGTSAIDLDKAAEEASRLATKARVHANTTDPLGSEISCAIEALTGQLRAVARLASGTTVAGSEDFQLREEAQPWRLQLQNWRATLLANITFQSASFRHAVRMAVFVALGDAIARGIAWQRAYWLPMTVAVILKPDFTTTFSRGLLRLFGTLAGLLLATGLYHAVPTQALPELILISIFTFGMRMFGPANYGVFSITISGLIVFLIAAIGTPPAEVVLQRGLNTLAGGCLALFAYTAWPTWERGRVSDVMAEMIDATRLYFRAVMSQFGDSKGIGKAEARIARLDWRRARSNAEASVDRVSSEPKMSAPKLSCLNSMLASSHALMHAIMGLEAGLQQSPVYRLSDALRAYSHDVEFTLYYLAQALRGSESATNTLPKLREDHRRLMDAADSEGIADDFVLIETDRLTTALNTLREQVQQFVH